MAIEQTPQEPNDDEHLRIAEEMMAAVESLHPEYAATPETLREAAPEVVEYKAMIADFEARYNLTELSADDALSHPVREPARLALNIIQKKLQLIKKETAIDDETAMNLENDYMRLSYAVGTINKGAVHHEFRPFTWS